MRQAALGMCAMLACSAFGQAGRPASGWDEAFADRSGDRPVHFVATYADAGGHMHRLEEWRVGLAHVRRRTDDRIDLHADASAVPRTGQPVEYVWQVLDLEKKVDHRMSSGGMLRVGMLYNYYAMAHVLSRPAGVFTVERVPGLATVNVAGVGCEWFEVLAAGQAANRVCWAMVPGIPLRTMTEKGGVWRTDFAVQTLDRGAVTAATFAVNPVGFQVRNVEELAEDD